MMPVMMKPEPNDQPVAASASASVSFPSEAAVHSQREPEPSGNPASLDTEDQSLEDIENRIDVDSIKGVFGWATVDGVNIPYIIRKFKKFVSVRIVEKKLLSRYPNAFPDELAKKDPLVSFFVTEYEAKLLNEINTIHCSYEYGNQPFTTKELIVDLVEFEDFYNIVKKTFPDEILAKLRSGDGQGKEAKSPGSGITREFLEKVCSWIQINNTVTPVIKRDGMTFVPLSVVKYAAGLLTNVNLEGVLPSPDDCEYLNETCKIAGFDFQFGKNTKLIELSEVVKHCQPTILQLPFEDPLKHARYLDTPSPSAQPPPPSQPSSPTVTPHTSPTPQNPITTPPMPNQQYPYQRPNIPVNPFAMMQLMTRSLVPQQLAYSQPGAMPNAMASQQMIQRMAYNTRLPTPAYSGFQQQQQNQQQMRLPYPQGYNIQHQGNVSNQSNARRNLPQDPMQTQPYQMQNSNQLRQGAPAYPYPVHTPTSSPYQPYQAMKASGRLPNSSTSIAAGRNSASSYPSTSPNLQPGPDKPKPNTTRPTNNTKPIHKIEGVVLNGKSISCLILNSPGRQGKFCLVEAVCKLYFSQCNIDEFLYVLQNVLNVPLYSCKDEEEKSFIQYYNLPVNVLKCNKMIKLTDLDTFFPQMNYIINQKSPDGASSNKDQTVPQRPHSANGHTRGDAVPSGKPASRKRPISGQGGGPDKKQVCTLERITQRLIEQKQTNDGSGGND